MVVLLYWSMAKLISTTTMILQNLFLVKNKGSKNRLCAQGRAGQAQHFFSGRRISQNEIRNSAAKKSESESEGGQKFLPPNPLSFCPPERSVFCSAFGGAINRSFVQKRFELRSVIATNSDILKIHRCFVARSPRRSLSRTAMRERVSLRKKPCHPALFQLRRVNISELNHKGGQIQIRFFEKANGGSACEARNRQSLFPIFSIPPEAEHKASFLIPRF